MDANSPLSPNSPGSLAVVPASESAYAKMKKMIASPRGKRRASTSGTGATKVFGVPLDEIVQRDSQEFGVPAAVHKMCQYIVENGICSEGIFRVNGNMKTVDKLKTQFDKNGDADLEDTHDVMAVASLLKMFLRELPDSVIPNDMQPSFIKVHSQLRENKEQHLLVLRHLIHKMPPSNFDLLKYLIEFLNQIADSSDSNKMTPVALAVVFGPNIFRCSDTLQGLQEQACVNAITCKLIEQSEYLFSTEVSNSEETPRRKATESSVDGETSPRKKPARPPPPKLQPGMTSPRKICEDENSNMVDNGILRISSTKNERSPRQNARGKGFQTSVVVSITEPGRSQSPPKSLKHFSVPMATSPSRKQILDNTIHDAVKEHLFGSSFVTSSSESDTQGNDVVNSPEDRAQGDSSQAPIRDMLKRYAAEKLSEFADKKNKSSTQSQLTDSNFRNSEWASPSAKSSEPAMIDQKSFDDMKDNWSGTLTSLTSNRAPPPRRKRANRSERKTQSDNIDELIKRGEYNGTREDMTSDLLLRTSDSKETAIVLNRKVNKSRVDNNENPLLVRIKTERTTKSLDDLDLQAEDEENSSPPATSKTITSSLKFKDKTKELDNGSRPVVPPLDLFRVQHEETEDPGARISPKERFSHVLADNPMLSPRSFSIDSQAERQTDHRQQVFLEKRQDTVPILDMSAKDLKKRIGSLKKIISNFESSFEAQHHRPPKQSEKAQVNKYIAELGRAKKQLRELMNAMKENPDRDDQTGNEIGFAPNLRDIKFRAGKVTKEDMLNALLKRLSEKRSLSGRPEELDMMSPEQLKDEKLAVQKALLQYESVHGRPNSKEDRTLMRPIYERYRRIKRLIATPREKEDDGDDKGGEISLTERSEDGTVTNPAGDLQPIIEGEPLAGSKLNNVSQIDTSDAAAVNDDNLNDTFNITRKPVDFTLRIQPDLESSKIEDSDQTTPKSPSSGTIGEAVLHDATLDELLKQQKLAKKSRKVLGKTLKDFEDDFLESTGRKVQKEDRGPMESEYTEYKQIRARLRLIEALITKKKASQTV